MRSLRILMGLLSAILCCGCQHPADSNPISISFCSLIQNRTLYAQRPFLTDAHLILDLHGELLTDPACPNLVLTFTSSPNVEGDSDQLNERLKAELAAHGYADVRVKFVGMLNPPSGMESASIWIKHKLGLPSKRGKDLIVRKIVSADTIDHANQPAAVQ